MSEMDKMEKLALAISIRNELRNYANRAGFGNNIAQKIYTFETEDTWCVSIPESLRRAKLNLKKGGKKPTGLKLEEGKSYIEQSIINGVRKYLATKQSEGMVTVR